MRTALHFSASVLVVVVASHARAEGDAWQRCGALVGNWQAGDRAKPEAGRGRFSLKFDLDNKVLVRRNHAELPARAGRGFAQHDDLMVIYRTNEGKDVRAIYFDSEDHVIHYAVSIGKDDWLVFLGEARAGQPRYRLSYSPEKEHGVRVKFEIAPPDKPMAFRVYLEGTASHVNNVEGR